MSRNHNAQFSTNVLDVLPIIVFYKWLNLGYTMEYQSLFTYYITLAGPVLYPRGPAYPVTLIFPQKPWSRHWLPSWIHLIQQGILNKIYLGPHYCWCPHQPPLWLSHQTESFTTPNHQDIHSHLLLLWLQLPIFRVDEGGKLFRLAYSMQLCIDHKVIADPTSCHASSINGKV